MDERTAEFDFHYTASRSARHPSVATLNLLLGESLGKTLVLDEDEVRLGRGTQCDLQFQVEGVSRVHARIHRSKTQRYSIEDLRSTNGVFVNGFQTLNQELKDGDRIALGPHLIFSFRTLSWDEVSALESLSASRSKDPLTGALTGPYFEEMLRFELELGQRRNFEVAVFCLELQGPDRRDEALNSVHSFLESHRKPGSLIGRTSTYRLSQSLAYTSRSEVEKTLDQLTEGLRASLLELQAVYGVAYSRELACPTPSLLLERAGKMTRKV